MKLHHLFCSCAPFRVRSALRRQLAQLPAVQRAQPAGCLEFEG